MQTYHISRFPEPSNTECTCLWCMYGGRYDVAQVCLGGHIINAYSTSRPDYNTKYCADCGESTITTCRECDAGIPGAPYPTGRELLSVDYTALPPKSYCEACGKPYPWTQSKIESFQELVDLSSLNKNNKTVLRDNITDIIRDTPRTEVACVKFVKILSKLKKQEPQLISKLASIATKHAKDLLIEVVSTPST